MRQRSTGLAAAIAGLLATAAATPGLAGGPLYRYVDERGVIHFTDAPTDSRFDPVNPPDPDASRSARAYDGVISLVARMQDVPPALVKAVIRTESNFNRLAVSPKGAQGLMQLMPSTAQHLGVQDPFESFQNVEGGVRYLRRLIDRYGSWRLALAAYNAGPEAVDHYGGIPPYRETREYVRKVLAYYDRYDADFAR
ncbi:MAG: lytic transglycosylase domain-containing protein [Deltaproteobacteria bacterium]|nr:MAG: lytic transglycosylase domain-containing protein [Deltaproteobacteria bacterium]